MDEGLQEGPTTARWLAWATTVLLALGVGSLGVLDAGESGSDAGVVSAAGGTAGTVEVTSPTTTVTTLAPPVTSTPPSTVARSTTVPKAAAAVLAAIGTTTTTQRPSATTSTTGPPVTSTTAPTTQTTVTTSTTVPGRATVTVANVHPNAFQVTLNNQEFKLDPGQDREVDLVLGPNGNYVLEAHAVADPTCEQGDGGAFQAGGRYRVEIVAAQGGCENGTVSNFDLLVRQL